MVLAIIQAIQRICGCMNQEGWNREESWVINTTSLQPQFSKYIGEIASFMPTPNPIKCFMFKNLNLE